MAAAGDVLVRTLRLLEGKVREGVTTAELDEAAEKYIRSQGATPAFKGYRGFPGSICASPNSMVVHGIPGPTGSSAATSSASTSGRQGRLGRRRRPHVPRRRGHAGGAEAPGHHAGLAVRRRRAVPAGNRLGDVSHAVQEVVEDAGLSVVRSLVGHGIGRDMHEDPQIPNYGEAGRGPLLEEGMVLAVEPMVNAGRTRCGWATTAGPSSARTARWRPTSSSRSRHGQRPSHPHTPGTSRTPPQPPRPAAVRGA